MSTPGMQCTSHLSALMVLRSRNTGFQWQSISYKSSTRGVDIRVMAATRETSRVNGSSFEALQVDQEAKPRIRAKNTSTFMLDPETVSCTLSNQTQTVVCCGLPDSPSSESYASPGESDSDDFDCKACWISVTGCSRQIHQIRHNRGFKRQTNHGKVVGVNIPKLRRIQKDYHDSWWRS